MMHNGPAVEQVFCVGPQACLQARVWLFASRYSIVLKGQVTMEELLFSLRHPWRFLESEMLELQRVLSM